MVPEEQSWLGDQLRRSIARDKKQSQATSPARFKWVQINSVNCPAGKARCADWSLSRIFSEGRPQRCSSLSQTQLGAALPFRVMGGTVLTAMQPLLQFSIRDSIRDLVLPCPWLITALLRRFLIHFRVSLNHQIQELMHSPLHHCSIYKEPAISLKPHVFPLSLTAQ